MAKLYFIMFLLCHIKYDWLTECIDELQINVKAYYDYIEATWRGYDFGSVRSKVNVPGLEIDCIARVSSIWMHVYTLCAAITKRIHSSIYLSHAPSRPMSKQLVSTLVAVDDARCHHWLTNQIDWQTR